MRFNLSLAKIAGSALLLASAAQAQLTLVEPSTDHWWVANSLNTLRWTGSTPTEFSVFLVNSDKNILTDKLALISVQPTYEYSKTVNPANLRVGGGYTIEATNPLNSTDVYATSQTFEIRAAGSPYPPQVTASTSAVSGSGSSTASPAGASASTSTRPNAGVATVDQMRYGSAVVGAGMAALAVYELLL